MHLVYHSYTTTSSTLVCLLFAPPSLVIVSFEMISILVIISVVRNMKQCMIITTSVGGVELFTARVRVMTVAYTYGIICNAMYYRTVA